MTIKEVMEKQFRTRGEYTKEVADFINDLCPADRSEAMKVLHEQMNEGNGTFYATPEMEAMKEEFDVPFYPHKTYRVLDSLDGIPLDTRIPLSEWIPPMDSEVAVISNKRMIGIVKGIKNNCVLIYAQGSRYDEMISLDGHWMRIV
jgi:hypothetical protein